MTPALTSILGDLEREMATLPAEDLPALLGELERLRALAWPRLVAGAGAREQPAAEDRLLEAKEAGEKLGMKVDYLYRHANRFPFTVRVTSGQVRFSLRGIEKFIRQRAGSRMVAR